MEPIKLAIVGLGKIARDQHVPALAADPAFDLAAVVTRYEPPPGLPSMRDLEELIDARPDVRAVSFCTPPQGRHALARRALEAGLDVMLEKPPGATVAEIEDLRELALARQGVLFATWHSRESAAVEPAREWLSEKQIRSVQINWKEDVRRWHPGQKWIWEAGGLGVFDPGINALSVLTRILPAMPFLKSAMLRFPSNCATPIAASLELSDSRGTPIGAEFDFLQTGPQTWEILVETDAGELHLWEGGAKLAIAGASVVDTVDTGHAEYPGLYRRFARLVEQREVDVDLAPFRLVADAFMIGSRIEVEPFVE